MDKNREITSHTYIKQENPPNLSRRDFLKASLILGLGQSLFNLNCSVLQTVRFGVATDSHYADRKPAGTRFYRDSLAKLSECVDLMNREKPDFLIELGDYKDQDPQPVEQRTLSYLQTIERVFRQFNGPTYHVLGNHDMDSLAKQQVLTNIVNTGIPPDQSYYSFDVQGFRFIVLDACFSADGTPYDHGQFNWKDANVPAQELDWLQTQLSDTDQPVVVFVHQLLDDADDQYCVRNAAQVRTLLERSGKTLAVFQGHYHAGRYKKINNIHYITLEAMVEGQGPENNRYYIVEIKKPEIKITGFRKAPNMVLPRSDGSG